MIICKVLLFVLVTHLALNVQLHESVGDDVIDEEEE